MGSEGRNVVVVGASGGIGGAFVDALADDDSVSALFAVARSTITALPERATFVSIDLTDEASIEAAATYCAEGRELDLVIVATGILHDGALQPEKSWRALGPDSLAHAFAINTIGPALVAKHFLPRLARKRRAVFAALSARVGSIGDNRLGGWYAYRASKAALNMLIKSLSIELARQNPLALVIGLHPGTVDTPLSKPFQGNVPQGKLFTPEQAARQLLDVITAADASLSGSVLAWDGQVILP